VNPNKHDSSRTLDELGDAAADLVGHFGQNAARLVGGVMSDAARVGRSWHGLSVAVAVGYIRTAAKAVQDTMQTVQRGVDGEGR